MQAHHARDGFLKGEQNTLICFWVMNSGMKHNQLQRIQETSLRLFT